MSNSKPSAESPDQGSQDDLFESRFGPSNPARIYPLLSSSGNRRLLRDWIGEREDTTVVEAEDPAEAEFDLCILDLEAAKEHEVALRSQKQAAAPAHLPSLLLLASPDWDAFNNIDGRLADSVLETNIDEIVSLPLKKAELEWRVQALLRLRSQSLQMLEKERELREFKEAADSAGHAIYITDPDGTIQYVNPAFEHITGYDATEAVGENPRLLQSGEMPETYYETLWETLSAGEVWEEEIVNRRRNGEVYHAKQTIAPILDAVGDIKSYVAIQMDITEQKRRERTLLEYKQAVNSSKDLLAAVDTDYQYLFANREYRTYHGVGSTDMTANSIADVIGEREFQLMRPKLEQALAGDVVQTEVTRELPTEGERILDARLFPLEDENGAVVGIGKSMRDITSQKRLQESLQQSKERYESLFNSIRDAILVADTDREIIDCNPAFVELFEYELADIEGEPTKTVYESEDEYERMGEEIEGHIGDPTFSTTITYEKQSGQTFPGETNVFYLRNPDGDIEGFIGVIRDVSDREDRLTQLQVIDRVLQHNFHNEMNVIQGFAQQIADADTSPACNQANNISEAGQRLLETVEKEREITNFLADPPPRKPIDLDEVCRVLAEELSERYPPARIEVTAEPVQIDATPALERAIEELLVNSIVHSTDDTPAVTLTVAATEEVITIEVRDHNPLIPEMERAVITGEKPLTPLYHGSGMGLWLVSLIVADAGGTLRFRENEPTGNVVTAEFHRN